jgi:NYN domain/OST-HTH/LOTUS domain
MRFGAQAKARDVGGHVAKRQKAGQTGPMAEPTDTRVAVYIDFDNIVISRYNQLHGRGNRVQKVKDLDPRDPATSRLLDEAKVDLGAVLDYASSFGTIAVSRAYADWSVAVNADYSRQLIERAVDLVQLFPTVASGKNGADIRLALDVAEDLFRLPHLTHVVIVAGDSDYIALAQRCKQLNRYVVGIGVAGSTSRALAYACNEFKDYDALPGVTAPTPTTSTEPSEPKTRRSTKPRSEKDVATDLLVRALQLGQEKTDDEWQSSAGIKSQMLRLDPTFQERALGFKTFTDFAQSLEKIVELDSGTTNRKIRLRTKS